MMKTKEGQAKVLSASSPSNAWRNRIVGYGEEEPAKLLANPRNWRIHPDAQREALGQVLDTIGWVNVAAVVNRGTGFVVDGHLRVSLAISRGEKTIPVAYIELTEAEEALVLASFDPITNSAGTDSAKLNDLLSEIDIEPGALDGLLASLFEEGQQTELGTVMDESGDSDESEKRYLGEKAKQIKPVLYAEQVAVFEQALRATGDLNRGHALIQVCQFYLDNAEREAGQFDSLLEAVAAN